MWLEIWTLHRHMWIWTRVRRSALVRSYSSDMLIGSDVACISLFVFLVLSYVVTVVILWLWRFVYVDVLSVVVVIVEWSVWMVIFGMCCMVMRWMVFMMYSSVVSNILANTEKTEIGLNEMRMLFYFTMWMICSVMLELWSFV